MSEEKIETLGDYMDALARIPASRALMLSFGGVPDLGVHSYRGCYEQCAIGWHTDDHPAISGQEWPTAGASLAFLHTQIGTTMQGYKGGTYPIRRGCELWVSRHGDANNCRVARVHESGIVEVVWSPES